MKFNDTDLLKLAKLARIKLDNQDIAKYLKEIHGIINIILELQKIDTENIEPLISVISSKSPLRADLVLENNKSEQILRNAPDSKFNCFVVPKVVE